MHRRLTFAILLIALPSWATTVLPASAQPATGSQSLDLLLGIPPTAPADSSSRTAPPVTRSQPVRPGQHARPPVRPQPLTAAVRPQPMVSIQPNLLGRETQVMGTAQLARSDIAEKALRFYGGAAPQQAPASVPRRLRPSTTPAKSAPRGKPFQNIYRDPTISPYLNLERQEDGEDLPNYFAFVRPQMQQIEANRQQQAQIQSLTKQLNSLSARGPAATAGAVPSTGHSTRFMDTAQFYRSSQR